MVEPVLAATVEAYLQTISAQQGWKHWYLVPSDIYLVKRTRIGGHLADGVVHVPGCRFASSQTNSARVHWEEEKPDLIHYWWGSAIEENPRKAGKTPPELKGFMKFCTTCAVVKPHYQKAREIYERTHPRPV